VTTRSAIKGCGTNNWGKIAHQFTAQIADNLSGVAALKALNTKFTTTDEVASIAHAIVFMDVVKSYFEYRVTTLCGIPTVELTGTKEDWQKLRKGLALLDDLDLSPWRAQLDRIFVHFEPSRAPSTTAEDMVPLRAVSADS
jgi:hypothetical protein